MAGGTLFYIKGSGFDMMTENNKVYIGDRQAKVIGNINKNYLKNPFFIKIISLTKKK